MRLFMRHAGLALVGIAVCLLYASAPDFDPGAWDASATEPNSPPTFRILDQSGNDVGGSTLIQTGGQPMTLDIVGADADGDTVRFSLRSRSVSPIHMTDNTSGTASMIVGDDAPGLHFAVVRADDGRDTTAMTYVINTGEHIASIKDLRGQTHHGLPHILGAFPAGSRCNLVNAVYGEEVDQWIELCGIIVDERIHYYTTLLHFSQINNKIIDPHTGDTVELFLEPQVSPPGPYWIPTYWGTSKPYTPIDVYSIIDLYTDNYGRGIGMRNGALTSYIRGAASVVPELLPFSDTVLVNATGFTNNIVTMEIWTDASKILPNPYVDFFMVNGTEIPLNTKRDTQYSTTPGDDTIIFNATFNVAEIAAQNNVHVRGHGNPPTGGGHVTKDLHEVSLAMRFPVNVQSKHLFVPLGTEKAVGYANTPPVAFPKTVTVHTTEPTEVLVTGTDQQDDHVYFTAHGASHGRAEYDNVISRYTSTIIYTPGETFAAAGSDTFTVVPNDGKESGPPVTIRVVAHSPPPHTTPAEITPESIIDRHGMMAGDPNADLDLVFRPDLPDTPVAGMLLESFSVYGTVLSFTSGGRAYTVAVPESEFVQLDFEEPMVISDPVITADGFERCCLTFVTLGTAPPLPSDACPEGEIDSPFPHRTRVTSPVIAPISHASGEQQVGKILMWEAGHIESVSVSVELEHQRPGSLHIGLESPNWETYTLRESDGIEHNQSKTHTFSPASVARSSADYAGLDGIVGSSASDSWDVVVTDTGYPYVEIERSYGWWGSQIPRGGQLLGWDIDVTYTARCPDLRTSDNEYVPQVVPEPLADPNEEPEFELLMSGNEVPRTIELVARTGNVFMDVVGTDEDGDSITFGVLYDEPTTPVSITNNGDNTATLVIDTAAPGAYTFYITANDGHETEEEPYSLSIAVAGEGRDPPQAEPTTAVPPQTAPAPPADTPRAEPAPAAGTTVPPLERAVVDNVRLTDSSGTSLDTIAVGQQVYVASQVTSGQEADQAYAYLVQVSDSDDITLSLTWTSGTLSAGESLSSSMSWQPAEPGEYTVTVFVWESIDNPAALSPQAVLPFTVS